MVYTKFFIVTLYGLRSSGAIHKMTRATIEVHHFFLMLPLTLGG